MEKSKSSSNTILPFIAIILILGVIGTLLILRGVLIDQESINVLNQEQRIRDFNEPISIINFEEAQTIDSQLFGEGISQNNYFPSEEFWLGIQTPNYYEIGYISENNYQAQYAVLDSISIAKRYSNGSVLLLSEDNSLKFVRANGSVGIISNQLDSFLQVVDIYYEFNNKLVYVVHNDGLIGINLQGDILFEYEFTENFFADLYFWSAEQKFIEFISDTNCYNFNLQERVLSDIACDQLSTSFIPFYKQPSLVYDLKENDTIPLSFPAISSTFYSDQNLSYTNSLHEILFSDREFQTLHINVNYSEFYPWNSIIIIITPSSVYVEESNSVPVSFLADSSRVYSHTSPIEVYPLQGIVLPW